MQGARIWLPNIEGFFTSLGRLLESAEGQRNTASYDSAEIFSRRLRENERTLVTLALRILYWAVVLSRIVGRRGYNPR